MIRPRTVARGIELFPARTPTLPPATHTNSYALGEREVLLVEPSTPYEDERREWLAWARGLVASGREIVAIFLTHHHADHVGGAPLFARELGVPTWAHEATRGRLSSTDVAIDRTLTDGETVALAGPSPQAWTVLHTPGHAPGHLCLHEASQGALVVGDMVASVGTILVEPHDGDMALYIAQIERLAGLDARVAFPAHGDPIDEPTALFQHYVAHRLKREQKVLSAVMAAGDAGGSIDELVAIAYDDTPPWLFPLAKMSLEAHLIKLASDGRVRAADAAWVALS